MAEAPVPDFSTRARRPSELRAIVEYILASPVLEETDYLEWKSGYDLSTRPGAASTAKQLIGMANRDFAQANRHAEGHAYVILGVEPGKLTGVPHLDSAEIEDALSRFIEPSLRYTLEYVEVDDKEVLIFTVEPPRQGDPVYCLQRESEEVSDLVKKKTLPLGAIYVRHGGKTEQHTPEDLKRLSARLIVEKATTLDLAVELDTSNVKVIPSELVSDAARDEKLQQWRTEMLAKLPKRDRSGYSAMYFASKPLGEQRSEEQFVAEVDMYIQTVKSIDNTWLRMIANDWVKAEQSVLGVSITNNTDDHYENAVVEIRFFGVARGNMFLKSREAKAVLQPPEKPLEWGEDTVLRFTRETQPVITSHLRPPEPEIERGGPGEVLVRYPEFRARPDTTHDLAPIQLALPPFMAGHVIKAHWRVTASNAKGYLADDLEFEVPGDASLAPAVPVQDD